MSMSSNDKIWQTTEVSCKWEYLYVAVQRLTPPVRNEILRVKVCKRRCYVTVKPLCQTLKLPPAWVKHILSREVLWSMKEKNSLKKWWNIDGNVQADVWILNSSTSNNLALELQQTEKKNRKPGPLPYQLKQWVWLKPARFSNCLVLLFAF